MPTPKPRGWFSRPLLSTPGEKGLPTRVDFRPATNGLFALFTVLLLVLLPHVTRLPVGILLMAMTVGVWWLKTLWLTGRPWVASLPVRMAGNLLAIALVVSHHGHLMGRDSGTSLLTALVFLKLLEFKSRRDPLIVLLLCCFLILTFFFHGQSFLMAIYAAVVVLLLVGVLILLQNPGLPTGSILRRAGLLVLQGVPLMLVLFLLFPRLPTPLWTLPRHSVSRTGISDRMEPGAISQVIRSGGVAFRVRFDGPLPPKETLYWRGPVLWVLIQNVWYLPSLPRLSLRAKWHPLGRPYPHTITLEPHNRRWLFALDRPLAAPEGARMLADFQLIANRTVRAPIRYRAESHLRSRPIRPLFHEERKRALQLPTARNYKARILGQRWAAEETSPGAIVDRALAMFRQQPFFYTLNPPRMIQNPVDTFLFESRRGFCEHYAGAFTFLMRAAGVPARVVTGYQGGEWNPMANHLTVRQADAHAWSEVWLPKRGWVRIDPTAAVAPQRVEQGLPASLPEGDLASSLIDANNPLLHRIWLAWDTMDNGWNQWVLGFDVLRQTALLNRFGWGGITLSERAVTLMAGTMLMLTLLSLFLLRRNTGKRPDLTSRLYQQFCNKLARHGMARESSEGPMDFAHRAAKVLPASEKPIQTITRLYVALRYHPDPPSDGLGQLRQQVQSFNPDISFAVGAAGSRAMAEQGVDEQNPSMAPDWHEKKVSQTAPKQLR